MLCTFNCKVLTSDIFVFIEFFIFFTHTLKTLNNNKSLIKSKLVLNEQLQESDVTQGKEEG